MDDQDPRLEGERGDPSSSGAASPESAVSAVDEDDEPRLRQLQEEVVEARAEVATTLGAIEDRLRPSSIAASRGGSGHRQGRRQSATASRPRNPPGTRAPIRGPPCSC